MAKRHPRPVQAVAGFGIPGLIREQTMFDLENEILLWKRALSRSSELEDGDIAELESHVRDEIRGYIGNGMDKEAAFRKATEDPAADALLSEYGKVRRLAVAPPAWHPSRIMPALVWNTVKVAFRKMRRQKGYSFINIVGLSLGMACCLLIMFWVRDELSYDRFHDGADRIYRINKQYPLGGGTQTNRSTPFPLAQAVKSTYAEIEEASVFFRRTAIIRYQDKIFTEPAVCIADPSFFKVFPFTFRQGDAGAALGRPDAAVITERTAGRYFADQDPIGKVITIDNNRTFTIAGVIENIPANSELRFDLFLPTAAMTDPDDRDSWGSHFCSTYVRLRTGAEPKALEAKLSALIKARLPEEKISLILQPLTKIHLYNEDGTAAGMRYVYFFSVIAVFILAIACINFINLSTARSEKRAKEVGLRKAVGADRAQLIRQFFGESTIFTLIALAGAVLMALALQAPFNELTRKSLKFSALGGDMLGGLAAIAVFTGLLAGSYPALVLSSFQPARVLRGTGSRRPSGKTFRKILVILQFSLSTILIIGTGVISRQIRFIRATNPGYDPANVLFLRMNDGIGKNYEVFKNDVLQVPDILGVSRASELPGETWSITRGVRWEGMTSSQGAAFGILSVDRDFLETMKIEISQGRNFLPVSGSETTNVLLNENAVRLMGLKDPIGKTFAPGTDVRWTILGVVKDFHALPLQYAIEPLVIVSSPGAYSRILIRVKPGADMKKAMARVEAAWKKAAPEFPFEYRFLNERFGLHYAEELRAGKLFKYFVVLAVFISGLGLLGLASFTAEQKTKEIGIRKILGASVPEIMVLLVKEFMKWVLLANVIAGPVAFFVMKGWLRNFAYRTEIGLPLFLGAAVLSLVIALMTVSVHAIRAARANPGTSLRYE
jgi:putative ABC transport system permease protein